MMGAKQRGSTASSGLLVLIPNAHHVLRPGGPFGFTVRAKPEEPTGVEIVLGAIEKHGKINVSLPPGPLFFPSSEPSEAKRSLELAGFKSVKSKVSIRHGGCRPAMGCFKRCEMPR